MTVRWIQYVFSWNWHLKDAYFTVSRNSYHDIIYSIYTGLCHDWDVRNDLEITLIAALSLMLAWVTFKFVNRRLRVKEMLPINYPIKLGQQVFMVHRSQHFIRLNFSKRHIMWLTLIMHIMIRSWISEQLK